MLLPLVGSVISCVKTFLDNVFINNVSYSCGEELLTQSMSLKLKSPTRIQSMFPNLFKDSQIIYKLCCLPHSFVSLI